MDEVSASLGQSVTRVLSTMFSLEAEAMPVDELQLSHQPLVAGSVGFIGDATGVVYIRVTADFARTLASRILGMPEAEIEGKELINDVIGELSNMVVGAVKSQLCDSGNACVLTIPSIVRGEDIYIAPISTSDEARMGFRCGQDHIMIQLQMESVH